MSKCGLVFFVGFVGFVGFIGLVFFCGRGGGDFLPDLFLRYGGVMGGTFKKLRARGAEGRVAGEQVPVPHLQMRTRRKCTRTTAFCGGQKNFGDHDFPLALASVASVAGKE